MKRYLTSWFGSSSKKKKGEESPETKWPEAKQKFIDTLQYVIKSEETRVTDGSFVKTFENNSDWSTNHFLKDNEDSSDVIMTSYQSEELAKKLDSSIPTLPFQTNKDETQSPVWFRFNRNFDDGADILKISEGTRVGPYLDYCQKMDPKRFGGLPSREDILSRMTNADLPKKENENIRSSLVTAMHRMVARELAPLCKKLHEVEGEVNKGQLQLVFGFGHVRKRYSSGKKEKIVNGPLLEVPLDIKVLETGDITVFPRSDSRVTENTAVLAKLKVAGGGAEANEKVVDDLMETVRKMTPNSLFYGKRGLVEKVLKKAVMMRYNTFSKQLDATDVHSVPLDDTVTILTEGWGLYIRKSIRTHSSQDAYKLIKAARESRLKLSPVIYAVMEGPALLDEIASHSRVKQIKGEDLVFPLPVSPEQEQIARKLFVEGAPAVIVDGPPGTGKTHSIVNCAAVALSLGYKTLIASSNPHALQAFMDKLPKKLLPLCMDLSCCESVGMCEFSKSLEEVLYYLSDAENHMTAYQSNMKSYLKGIQQKKEARELIVDKHAKRSAFLQSMHKNDDFKAILAVAETLEPWLVSVALTKKGQEILKELESLSNAQQREISELQTFEYHGADYGKAIEFACRKCKETSRSKQVQQPHTNCGDSFFDFRPASETNDLLNELKVDGRSPSSNGEWSRVQRGLEYQQSRVAWNETGFPLLRISGCPTEQIYSNDGTCTFHVDLPKKLQKAEELEELLNKLPRETYEQLYEYVTSSDFKTTQDEFRKLTTDIQELESELVFVQAIVNLNQELTPDHRSQFVQLSQKVKKFSNNALSSGGAPSTKVGVRLDEELKESFNSVAKFWPFVVMTESQVGRYVFEDHCFDLAVLDEASQSNCNAISILSRCKQLLVVGDDKQVSPSTIGTSEERIRELKRALPNIPSANNLLPESSFFDFLKTAFPTSSVILREHFRSDPRIISISNDWCYNKQMTPLKLPSKAVAVEHVALTGTMDSKKVNKVEAVFIVDQVLCQIKRTKENGSAAVDTIGVISLGGSNQSKYIEGLYKEKVDSIRTLYGSEIVDKHKVRFGVPSELQGDERDQIFLSGVYSADKTISLQARPSDWKQLNVALTRAKKKLVLVCSYESRHLKPMDVRRPVLEKFHDATASTGYSEWRKDLELCSSHYE